MDTLMQNILFIIIALASSFALTVVHEFGHFGIASFLDKKIHAISLGMGKVLFKFNWRDFVVEVRMFPVAGSVSFSEKYEMSPRLESMRSILVFLAGPLVNFILGFCLLWGGMGVSRAADTQISLSSPKVVAQKYFEYVKKFYEISGENIRAVKNTLGKVNCLDSWHKIFGTNQADLRFFMLIIGFFSISLGFFNLVPLGESDGAYILKHIFNLLKK